MVARYLTLLRKRRKMRIKDVRDSLPRSYFHTVGHWFREDLGGSIPIPQDVPLLRRILEAEDSLLSIIERTALKLQTVKASVKGKNPGDFIEGMGDADLIRYLRKLYIPSHEYIKLMEIKGDF